MKKSGLAHCCHHDRHWEYCYDYDERVKFIKEHKPKSEQELRLKLFFIVPDKLVPGKDSEEWEACVKAREAYVKAREAYYKAWEAYVKAREACDKAREAYDKAWEACVKAREAYVKAREAYFKKYSKELDELCHKLCPDCTWNGETIF